MISYLTENVIISPHNLKIILLSYHTNLVQITASYNYCLDPEKIQKLIAMNLQHELLTLVTEVDFYLFKDFLLNYKITVIKDQIQNTQFIIEYKITDKVTIKPGIFIDNLSDNKIQFGITISFED